jgi:hypothetical protein
VIGGAFYNEFIITAPDGTEALIQRYSFGIGNRHAIRRNTDGNTVRGPHTA